MGHAEVEVVRDRAWVRQQWSSEVGLGGTGMWLWGQKCNHGDKRPWEQKWDHRDSIMGREWAHSGRGGAVGIKDGTRVEVT